MSISKKLQVLLLASSFVGGAWVAPVMAAPDATPSSTANAATGHPDVSETFGDWRYLCETRDSGRMCVLAQHQIVKTSGQTVLNVEFTPLADGRIRSLFTLPFGVLLPAGVTLQVDGQQLGRLQYRACFPTGCVAGLDWDASLLTKLRAAKEFKVLVQVDDAQSRTLALNVDLKGIGQGLNRLTATSSKKR